MPLLRLHDHEVQSLSDREFYDRCTPFVTAVVADVRRAYRLTGELEDLMAAGHLGLVEARARFDPTARAEFATYAYWRVRGAIIDACRKQSETSRRYQERIRAAANHADLVATQTDADMRASLADRVTAATAQTLLAQHITNVILVAGLSTNFEYVFSPPTQEKAVIHSELEAHLKAAVETLSDIDRELLFRLYYLNETTEEVGRHFAHTKSWVSRAHSRAIGELQRYFRKHNLLGE